MTRCHGRDRSTYRTHGTARPPRFWEVSYSCHLWYFYLMEATILMLISLPPCGRKAHAGDGHGLNTVLCQTSYSMERMYGRMQYALQYSAATLHLYSMLYMYTLLTKITKLDRIHSENGKAKGYTRSYTVFPRHR